MACNDFDPRPRTGEVWLAEVTNAEGNQQGGRRPFLIYSNDVFNTFSPTVNAYPISSKTHKRSPVHVKIFAGEVCRINVDSIILIENPWTLNKSNLIEKYGQLSSRLEVEVADRMIFQCPLLKDRLDSLLRSFNEVGCVA